MKLLRLQTEHLARSSRRVRGAAGNGLCSLLALALASGGCKQDVRLSDDSNRDVTVGTVSAYGMTLDQDANIEEVVFVLLKAVVEDLDAADAEARRRAVDTQFKICAPDHIRQAAANLSLTDKQREERLVRVVKRWAPTLGFYHDDFRVGFDELKERMLVVRQANEGEDEAADVWLNVAHPDPKKRPQANVVARFRVVRASGYWRIAWVGWENSTRNWQQQPPSGVAVRGK